MNMTIKNNIRILSFAAMLFCCMPLSAQTVVDDFDDEEEEVDSVFVPIEDEIAVTDKEGNEEVIEFPEAMTYDLDSLLNLYMSRTFLGTPGDCEMTNEKPTYPKEEYVARLSRIPSVMELASALLGKLHAGCGKFLYAAV